MDSESLIVFRSCVVGCLNDAHAGVVSEHIPLDSFLERLQQRGVTDRKEVAAEALARFADGTMASHYMIYGVMTYLGYFFKQRHDDTQTLSSLLAIKSRTNAAYLKWINENFR